MLLVSCLAGAMLLWTTRPAVSLILLGVGASQNPGLVLVAALFAAWGSIERPARLMCRRWQTGVLVAALLIALPPAYYLWRLGIPSPLTAATVTRWPGLFDALFPFTDVSVGLVFRYPPFVAGGARRRRRGWRGASCRGCASPSSPPRGWPRWRCCGPSGNPSARTTAAARISAAMRSG